MSVGAGGGMLPALALLLLLAAPATARRHAPDLREDEPARRTTRPAECQFGKQAKELGSTWFADLGPPFGVMYCIKCECISVQKKRRVVAKVHCRNIKNECPEPSCDTPVLLPGRCCKTCPGDVDSPDIVQEDSPTVVITGGEEEELSMKHFGALLTGRSPLCIRRDDMTGVAVAPGVATARFTFRRRHLFWSVLLGPSIVTQPRSLAFLDRGGRMLLEHPLKRSPGIHATYEEKTDKLCGVWRRVPREYKRLLRDGSLYVALIWGDERNNSMDKALSGRINRYPALSTEMFTTLLEPEHPPASIGNGACDDYRTLGQEGGWWGGTAIVTGAAGAAPSLHLAIIYNGIFTLSARDQSVRVLLTLPERNQTIIDEIQKVPKPGYEMNILEVSTPVSAAELRSLSRGRLLLAVQEVGTVERRIVGAVRQKAACEVYHACLVAERAPASPAPEGLALIYIDKEGSLVYDIQVDNLGISDPKITLVEEQGKRHSQVEILDTRVGVLARPSARIFPPLYEDQLAVHIGADAGPPILRGRLLSRSLPDAAGLGPALLRRTDARTPTTLTPMAGLAWLSVDSLCGIQYEVVVTGATGAWSSWLETHSGSARALGGAEGCVLEPAPAELAALQAGTAHLNVRAADNVTQLLRTRVPQISVPPSCLPTVPWTSDNELGAGYSPTHVEAPPPDNSLTNTASCYYAGRFYEDGAQWMSTESCQMCGCVHGVLRCDAVRCPRVTCATPTIQPPGQCCPICTNSTTAVWNESHGCHLAGQYHAPGSSWHPYLVPDGYDLCAVCTCDFATRQVRCPRVRCPPLRCAEKDAYRPDKKACCRVCPEEKIKKVEEETPKDQGAPRTAEEILAEGGCKFPDGPLPNGKEVHPSIHSHGEQRCVTCRCKDGEVTCVRKRCGRAACARRRRGDSCCACARHRRQRAPRPAPS
ncbi:PREDICTED: dorsal-ventral patterning protein Sog [Papilio xuthus]|uniref:Dorsal-ventral patterning protein Sog n=1 Tax=Papilio xuthus TaxID=66420 RepID=A0AAJ7E6E5_PAPXU|nr:PREDICTED: dorsal-ventral patterning protein Sog [Papilio xuthus]